MKPKKKGHKYITLFVDLDKRRTIFIADGKSSKTIEEFTKFLRLYRVNSDQIEYVSCDMSPAFIKGVRENLDKAEITFDKFHIIKIINNAVDEVRREEVKEQSILTGKRYLFLKNRNNLTDKQAKELETIKLSKLNLKTYRALRIREAFQNIYKAEFFEEYAQLLKQWYYWATHSKIDPIKEAAKTIKNHWDGILSWKKTQINNGILEGLNSVIQAAKSKARGFKNSEYMKTIAYIMTGKLDFDKINKHYTPIK